MGHQPLVVVVDLVKVDRFKPWFRPSMSVSVRCRPFL